MVEKNKTISKLYNRRIFPFNRNHSHGSFLYYEEYDKSDVKNFAKIFEDIIVRRIVILIKTPSAIQSSKIFAKFSDKKNTRTVNLRKFFVGKLNIPIWIDIE